AAYAGGGFATGLHNTLAPAVFGIPVIIGPQYEGFQAAQELVALQGILPISNFASLEKIMNHLWDDPKYSTKTGDICKAYVADEKGATNDIMSYIDKWLMVNG